MNEDFSSFQGYVKHVCEIFDSRYCCNAYVNKLENKVSQV